jgi:two-component system chemotaxis response regulator CheB
MTPPRSVVAMAASAGGFRALSTVLSGVPRDVPAAFVIVQHLDPNHPSVLAELLGRRCQLEVRQAAQDDDLREGLALVAPPDHHLLVSPEATCTLTTTELVHFVRPSADLLFESVAAAFGPAATAVVLSGTGVDGSLGVAAVKERGGTVIVQDSAQFGGMPEAAVATGIVDIVLPLDRIARAVAEVVRTGAPR